MFFKPKFFLDLSGDSGEKAIVPAKVAPMRPAAEPAPGKPAETAEALISVKLPAAAPAATPAAAIPAAPAPAAPAATSSGLTTAEAIAAELAAEQANRPEPSLSTFAAECLVPGGASTPRRRRGGANLAGFRAIARSYLKN
ncbi:MAG: hypothetical protein ACKOZT_05700 [Cyanobium sp.]